MKYSIHRVLSLKKSTIERLKKVISSAKFVAVVQGKSKNIKGVPVQDVEQEIRKNWQEINKLFDNYSKLKSALLSSNAGLTERLREQVVTEKVAGKSYTISELIDTSEIMYGKSGCEGLKGDLLCSLTEQYNDVLNSIETQKRRVEDQIRDYLLKAASNDKQLSTEDIEKRSQMFKEDGEYRLVDPLDISKKIEELRTEIDKFRDECDATLSEHNAVTVVEIDLTD